MLQSQKDETLHLHKDDFYTWSITVQIGISFIEDCFMTFVEYYSVVVEKITFLKVNVFSIHFDKISF